MQSSDLENLDCNGCSDYDNLAGVKPVGMCNRAKVRSCSGRDLTETIVLSFAVREGLGFLEKLMIHNFRYMTGQSR